MYVCYRWFVLLEWIPLPFYQFTLIFTPLLFSDSLDIYWNIIIWSLSKRPGLKYVGDKSSTDMHYNSKGFTEGKIIHTPFDLSAMLFFSVLYWFIHLLSVMVSVRYDYGA